ncbi:MAG: radical SAM protein [Lachnospiraceae bacterium]|nr:radical SAM protein [Lachnospiraceae bacterium]
MSNDNYDCLIIGNNSPSFQDYVNNIKQMGFQSGAFRDLSLNYISEKGIDYSFADYYNHNFAPNREQLMTYNDIMSATIAYLGSYLHKKKISFLFINSFQEQKKELTSLLGKKICAIAITTTYYLEASPIIEIIKFIKKYNGDVKIIVGGPFIANQSALLDRESFYYVLKMIDADYYINSTQGELALSEVISSIKGKKDISHINNIIYMQNGNYVENENVSEDNCLENNPVNWKLFSDTKKNFVSVRTSKSCPFECLFCGFPQRAGKFDYITPARLCEELDQINEIPDIKIVNFLDDTFNVPVNRFKEILQIMIGKQYRFKWNAHIRCQYINREIVDLMKRSGCQGVFLGVESGNQKILDNMNKKALVDDYYKGVALLKEYGIITYMSFIIGFPGETAQTIKETIQFIETTQPDFYRTQLWYCDPVTPINKFADRFGIKNAFFEWEHSTMNAKEASDWIEYIMLNIKESMWLPQNNFDYPGLFILLSKGWELIEIKSMINDFNIKLKAKIQKGY